MDCKELKWIETLANNYTRDIQQPDKYKTAIPIRLMKVPKKVTFEAVYGSTWMTMSGRSVRDHDWCVWIYLVIRLILSVTNKLY